MVYVLHHGVFVVGYICIVCVCRSHLSIYEILYESFFFLLWLCCCCYYYYFRSWRRM